MPYPLFMNSTRKPFVVQTVYTSNNGKPQAPVVHPIGFETVEQAYGFINRLYIIGYEGNHTVVATKEAR